MQIAFCKAANGAGQLGRLIVPPLALARRVQGHQNGIGPQSS
jgi:hypothetical protein